MGFGVVGGVVVSLITGLSGILIAIATRRESNSKASLNYVDATNRAVEMVQGQAVRLEGEVEKLGVSLAKALASLAEEEEHRKKCEKDLADLQKRIGSLEDGEDTAEPPVNPRKRLGPGPGSL